ncbi:MAG: hypothetical protein ABW199_05695, partial [Caulobacterales bacterium]
HLLPKAVRWDVQYEILKEEISEETSTWGGDVFISSENFELLDEPSIQKLLRLFPNYSFKILFFYRSWTPLIYSSWQESVKHGSVETYSEYALNHIAFPQDSVVLNFRLPIERWARAVGYDRIAIASYETVVATEDISAFALKWLGVNRQTDLASGVYNKSLDHFSAETVRVLNELALKDGFTPGLGILRSYTGTVNKVNGPPYKKVLAELMRPYVVSTPNLGASVVASNFFSEFLAQYSNIMIDCPKTRENNHNVTKFELSVVTQRYLQDSLARMAITDLWHRISLSLISKCESHKTV